MRLKHIKLVGFKSFVDATKVPFPHQMTCVVGPNGCGKSNVIDAVRWVLGESSAKNLRGDAMTDVIFNGSTARKPVSQASVELVFDNSQERLQGEFAKFQEVSVKRQVTRDGQSNYFLNGSKCRRRDITDLFLGTGLGPRSYAIIEQGMISRLIESKPQELRVFIEEAAGISRYKERRKETESRISHTRDNLDRLNDVRDELGKNLEKLQRQAAAARRYKTLKTEERQTKAQLQALRWLRNDAQAIQLREQLAEFEIEQEKWLSVQTGGERENVELQEQTNELKAQLDTLQQSYYQLGSDITRIEQQQHHQRQLAAKQAEQQQQWRDEQAHLHGQQGDAKAQQQEAAELLTALEPKLSELQASHSELETSIEQLEIQLEDAQAAYQTRREKLLAERQVQSQGAQRQQWLQQELKQAQQQRERAQQEYQRWQDKLEHAEQQQAQWQTADEQAAAKEMQAVCAEVEQRVQALLAQQKHHQQQLQNIQQQHQQCLAQQSSIERLLQIEPDAWVEPLNELLSHESVTRRGTVADWLAQTQTDAKWRIALDFVLSDWLQAPIIEHAPQTSEPLAPGSRWLVLGQDTAPKEPLDDICLASKMQGPLSHWRWLQCIGTAEDTAQVAVRLQKFVAVATPDGALHFPQACSYSGNEPRQQRSQLQQELNELQLQAQQLHEELAQAQAAEVAIETQLQAAQTEQEDSRKAREHGQQQLIRAQEQHQFAERQAQEAREQCQSFNQQIEALSEQNLLLEAQLDELSSSVEQQDARLHEIEHEIEQSALQWEQQRDILQQQRHQQRQQLQQLQHQERAAALEKQRLQSEYEQTERQQIEYQRRLQQLGELIAAQSSSDNNETQEDLEVLQLQLEELLLQREQVEANKRDCQNQLSELEQQLKERNSGAQEAQLQLEKVRGQMESVKLELSTLAERGRAILAVLEEMQQPLKPVLESMPTEASETKWQHQLEQLQQSIQRLGAINLAAIDEAESQAERKHYLDKQHEDLQSSLETLETAIRKIDKETRQRFKTTYDAVNTDLQELFPKVFGGGNAYLELTDDDLLDTGVTIMARPPGKKNSTIHLLSGGEKALTALSLVFAIFRLNPAPFCLLDEVDAPLDDANVGRFCRLVEEMSKTVQFIYISHNKVAMEMAQHLAGVTMQEPGVSRLVAVDVETAVAMAEAG